MDRVGKRRLTHSEYVVGGGYEEDGLSLQFRPRTELRSVLTQEARVGAEELVIQEFTGDVGQQVREALSECHPFAERRPRERHNGRESRHARVPQLRMAVEVDERNAQTNGN